MADFCRHCTKSITICKLLFQDKLKFRFDGAIGCNHSSFAKKWKTKNVLFDYKRFLKSQILKPEYELSNHATRHMVLRIGSVKSRKMAPK